MVELVFKPIPETSEALDSKLVGGSRILKCTQDREKLWWAREEAGSWELTLRSLSLDSLYQNCHCSLPYRESGVI